MVMEMSVILIMGYGMLIYTYVKINKLEILNTVSLGSGMLLLRGRALAWHVCGPEMKF